MNTTLPVDATEIARFTDALFRYADEDTFVALRGIHQTQGRPAFLIESVQISVDPPPLADPAAQQIGRPRLTLAGDVSERGARALNDAGVGEGAT